MSVVDDYIAGYEEPVASRLRELLAVVRAAAPGASEVIAWGMPTFKIGGKNVVHFARHARHIGLYPSPRPIEEFADELSGYKTSKGAIQLPDDRPLPLDLVRRIVESQVARFAPSA